MILQDNFYHPNSQAQSQLFDALILPRERLDAIPTIEEGLEAPPKVERRAIEQLVQPAGQDAVVLVKRRLVMRAVLLEGQSKSALLQPLLPGREEGRRRMRPPVELLR